MNNGNTKNIYIYILSKKIENPQALYEKTKSKYEGSAKKIVSGLDDYLMAAGKKNLEERLVTAALIIESVFNQVFFASFPIPDAFEKDYFGKPRFSESDVKISIAHNEDFAVVAYMRGREIGVDIEGEIPTEKAEKLAVRFPAIASLDVEKNRTEIAEGGTKICLFEMLEDGRFESLPLTFADDCFAAKWTTAEALMKCDGRGFSAIGEIKNLIENINIFSFYLIVENKKIYISLAEKQ